MWCSTVGVIVTLTLSILATPLAAHAQPAEKVHGSVNSLLASPSPVQIWKPSGRGCATLAMWRARTSSSSPDMPRESSSAFPTWQPSWSAARLTSLWQ